MTVHIRSAVTTLAAIVSLIGASASRAGDVTSPLGAWTTIDDSSGKARGVVRIYLESGKYFGKLEKSFRPGAETRRCTQCVDERKDKPVLGLVIIRNMTPGDEGYSGGDILDPDNGSVYHCKFTLENGGMKLRVRGYIGISLFGRTQVWERAE